MSASLISSSQGNEEMNSDINFRLANELDLPIILDITKLVVKLMNDEGNFQWNDSYPLESNFRVDLAENVLWVAEINNEVVGYMAITTHQEDEYSAFWDTSLECIVPHRLAISPKVRNKGIAQSFMQLAEKIARERGFQYVRVDTNEINLRMNHIFIKLGYTYCGLVSFAKKGPAYAHIRFKCYQKDVSEILADLPSNEN